MNREILFRGKRTDNGEWVKGYLFELRLDNATRIAIQGWSVNEVIPETVSQYTGLKDCNENMIFGSLITKVLYKIAGMKYQN